MTSNYLPVYHIDTLDILPPASYKTIGIEKHKTYENEDSFNQINWGIRHVCI